MRMKISACVIAKNEEKTLPRCLESVKDIVSEMIVVDTGSTDRTVEAAQSCGAKVYHFEWIDDFSAAKNFAISKARGNWIVFLDADEYFSTDSIPRIKDVIKFAHQNKYDFIKVFMSHLNWKTKKLETSSENIRMFRNDPHIRYVGVIHEMVIRSNYPARVLDATKQITVIHTGYSPETIQEKKKSKRNLDLLFRELEKKPKSSNLAFYISEAYMLDKDFENSLKYAKKVLEYRNSTLSGMYEKNYLNMIQCMRKMQYPETEVLQLIYEAVKAYPTVPDFYLHLGDIYVQKNRNVDAIEAYQKGLAQTLQTLRSGAHFHASNVYKTLGQLYYKLGNLQECIESYVNSLKIDKYNYRSLTYLLRVLNKYENTESITGFLQKMYDQTYLKDKLLLLNASLDIRNLDLAEYYWNLLPDHKTELTEQYASIEYLRGNYETASERFFEHYQSIGNEQLAIKAIAAALYRNDTDLLNRYSDNLPAPMANLIRVVCGNVEQLGPFDRQLLLLLLNEHIQMKKWETLLSSANLIDTYQLLLEVADLFFHQEEFGFAAEFYDMFLQKEQDMSLDLIPLVLIKLAECLYQTGDYSSALKLLEQAQSLLPTEYAIYELQLRIYSALNDQDGMVMAALQGQVYFPDSSYLKAVPLLYK
jgi:glycosyltransferase involved in cell wall biosynthesis